MSSDLGEELAAPARRALGKIISMIDDLLGPAGWRPPGETILEVTVGVSVATKLQLLFFDRWLGDSTGANKEGWRLLNQDADLLAGERADQMRSAGRHAPPRAPFTAIERRGGWYFFSSAGIRGASLDSGGLDIWSAKLMAMRFSIAVLRMLERPSNKMGLTLGLIAASKLLLALWPNDDMRDALDHLADRVATEALGDLSLTSA